MSQDDRIAIFTAPDEKDVLTWDPPDYEALARQLDGSIDEITFEDCKSAAAMLRALVQERDAYKDRAEKAEGLSADLFAKVSAVNDRILKSEAENAKLQEKIDELWLENNGYKR